MKQGKTIQNFAQEVIRQANGRKDFLADTPAMAMASDLSLALGIGSNPQVFDVTDYCHGQIASRLKIPKTYYDRMKNESPKLLTENVNHWFKNNPEKRMVRTLDGNARAFLSDRYRTLDNLDLMKTTLPVLQEMRTNIISCEVTEKRLYIKVLFPKVTEEVTKDDIVQAGIVISNSEIGAGSLRIEPLIYRLVCTNGMIANTSMRKYHVGRGNGSNFEDIQELLTDKTKERVDAAFWLQVRDVIKSSFNRDIFMGNVDRLRQAAEKPIKSDNLPKVVEVVQKQYNLNDSQGNNILNALCRDGDFSQWGLANAVTNIANNQEDYDIATDLERIGGKIIELSPKDWNKISEAA